MSQPEAYRISCKSVSYRQGYLEVTPVIHEGCVNIEFWEVSADKNIESCDWVDHESILESDVISNGELEMTASEAKEIAYAILRAADSAEQAR